MWDVPVRFAVPATMTVPLKTPVPERFRRASLAVVVASVKSEPSKVSMNTI